MKNWWNYFALHLGTAWALGIYLFLVTVLGQFFLLLVPFFKIQLGIALQIIAFVPFYLSFPHLIARKTGDYLPENQDYYSSFGVAHFPGLVMLISFFLAYFNLKTSGIQDTILEEMDLWANSTVVSSGVLSFFLELMAKLPGALIQLLDDVLLFFILYEIGYFIMVVALERRRLKLVFRDV